MAVPPPPSAPPRIFPMSARAMPEGSTPRIFPMSGRAVPEDSIQNVEVVECLADGISLMRPPVEECDEAAFTGRSLTNWYEEDESKQPSQNVMFDMAADDDDMSGCDDDGTYEAAFDFIDVIMEAAEESEGSSGKAEVNASVESDSQAAELKDPLVETESSEAPGAVIARETESGEACKPMQDACSPSKALWTVTSASATGSEKGLLASEALEKKLSQKKSRWSLKGRKRSKLQALRLEAAQAAALKAATSPLLPSWEMGSDDRGRKYFFNHLTSQSSWCHPAQAVLQDLLVYTSNIAFHEASKARLSVAQGHIKEVQSIAEAELQSWSGPHWSTEHGLPYYYHLKHKQSVWCDPAEQMEAELKLRRVLLWSLLALEEGALDAGAEENDVSERQQFLSPPKRSRRARSKQGRQREKQSPSADALYVAAPQEESDSEPKKPPRSLVAGDETLAGEEVKSKSRSALLELAFCKCFGFGVRAHGL